MSRDVQAPPSPRWLSHSKPPARAITRLATSALQTPAESAGTSIPTNMQSVNKISTHPVALTRQPSLSHGDSGTGNWIIQGDNLAVLHSIRDQITGQVRCVYIDPPYNNQEKYRHYTDTRNHNEWIEILTANLLAIRPLLTRDGSVWISIDDSEMHYLKVAADRVFGRENFLSTIIWQQRTTRENRKAFSNNHEYLLVYAADYAAFRKNRNLLPPSDELLARYKNPDSDSRGPWQSISANVQDGHATDSQYYDLIAPNGLVHRPPRGRCWVYSLDRMKEEISAGNIWFGRDGNGVPRIKRFLRDSRIGLTPETLWMARDVGTNEDAKKQQLELFRGGLVFDTPKPEPLIARILEIADRKSVV